MTNRLTFIQSNLLTKKCICIIEWQWSQKFKSYLYVFDAYIATYIEMVWKDLVKHSPLYNTHRKDQKTPERHPASPPLLQGRAPPAIAETSLLLQDSLHVSYRKILYGFNNRFQLLPLAAAICQPTKDSSHIKKHNEQKTSNERNHPAAAATCPAVHPLLATWSLPTNICQDQTCSLQWTHFKVNWGYLRMFPSNCAWHRQWDGHVTYLQGI